MVDESLIAYLEGKLIESFQKKSGLIPKTPLSQKSMFGRPKPTQTEITPSDPKMPAGVTKEINNKLRHLLSYTTEDHLFSDSEVKIIIAALDNAKILDPACGSGAFPMGILHKMVHILSKLDPQNKQWKQRQIENQTRQIKQDVSYAEQIKDNKARQKALDELEERLTTINDAFDTNELDFGRKLYLIENCIFGVDIQPIAVQIAKLRFFISLIVDQIIDENKENLGIIPLPNLETKFVAANTLIGVEKKGQIGLNFQNLEITKKEKELAKVRERHFSARTPNTKEKYRQIDENLRNEIAELLKKDGFASDLTKKLAHWNPYDQNTFADFFDMEWMFGVKDGFDIVIGNPPYARIQTLQLTQPESVPYYKNNYISAKGNFDIYILFLEKGFALLNKKGGLSYILPHKFFQAKFGLPIRKFFVKNKALSHIVRFGAEQVFESSTTYTCLLFLSKMANEKFLFAEINDLKNPVSVFDDLQFRRKSSCYETAIIKMPKSDKWDFCVGAVGDVLNKILKQSVTLGDITRKIFVGLQTSADKIYVLKVLDKGKKFFRCYSKSIEREVEIEKGLVKPFLLGKDIHRYSHPEAKNVVIFPYNLEDNQAKLMSSSYIAENFPKGWEYLIKNRKALEARERDRMKEENFYAYIYPKNLTEFDSIKIMTPDICRNSQATIDQSAELYHTTTIYSFIFNKDVKESPKFFLGVMNSTLLWFFLKATGTVLRGGYLRFKTEYLRPFPIVCSVSQDPPSDKQQKIIIGITDKILAMKKLDPVADTTALETEIDGRVAHLYNLTEEEYALVLKETNCPDPFRVAALNVYRDIAREKLK